MTIHLIVICKAPSMLNQAKHRDSAKYLGMCQSTSVFLKHFSCDRELKALELFIYTSTMISF